RARAVARPQAPRPVAPPPPGATVLAGESGDRAVGLAVLPGGRLQATVLGPDDDGVDGLSVGFRVSRRTLGATPCGPGCYRPQGRIRTRRVTVVIASGPVALASPAQPQPARELVPEAGRADAARRR